MISSVLKHQDTVFLTVEGAAKYLGKVQRWNSTLVDMYFQGISISFACSQPDIYSLRFMCMCVLGRVLSQIIILYRNRLGSPTYTLAILATSSSHLLLALL